MSLTASRSQRRRLRLVLTIAAWTAIAVIVALILRIQNGLPLMYALESSLAWYYSLGAFVWLAGTLDARWQLWKRRRARALLVHVAMGLVFIGLWCIFIVAYSRVTVGPDYWASVFGFWWMFQLLTTATVYAAGVGVGLLVRVFEREREREEREARLKVLAREAELTAIKAQLQPHFLFNALNSVLALIDHDPAEARQMIARLASLLHSLFDRLDQPLVPLDREMDIIRDYLEIEQIRFGDRMTFTIDVDAAVREVPVPPFLLQPIVENAVKHGIEPFARPGCIRIVGRRHQSGLCLSVSDTGRIINGAAVAGLGRGLALTRTRLQAVYGPGAASLRENRGPDGLTVTLELPAEMADVS